MWDDRRDTNTLQIKREGEGTARLSCLVAASREAQVHDPAEADGGDERHAEVGLAKGEAKERRGRLVGRYMSGVWVMS